MATILPQAETTFTDSNGVPLAGGTVTFYIPGTTTPKDTWQNSGQSILNSNPVVLDSAGRAIIYGSGSYRQVVKDSAGNLIWDQVTAEPGAGPISFGGTSSGTANAQTLSSGTFSGVDGSILSFIAGLSNSGSMTMSVGGSAPILVTKNGPVGPVTLASGDIIAGNVYSIQYNASTATFQLLQSVSPNVQTGTFLAGYLFGLTLSNNGADAVNDIDIAPGSAASDGATPALMTLASVLTKRLDANWVVGTNQGGLDTGSIANATYHVWLIARSDTGVVDALFSTSATAPTMPANYDRKRRIGSILREGGTIIAFTQNGDVFHRTTAILEYQSTVSFASALKSWNVPAGIKVQPILIMYLQPAASSNIYYALGDATTGTADVVVHQARTDAGGPTESRQFINGGFFTNTSAQSYFQHNILGGSAAVNSVVNGKGWIDDRGRTS
jgi:hypothetical protein